MSSSRTTGSVEPPETAIWQEVEFGSYRADLPLWAELAKTRGEPVLELGAGAGRVALQLAAGAGGTETIAIDRDRELAAELERRAEQAGTPLTVLVADLAAPAGIALPSPPRLAIAPLHVLQELAGSERRALLGALAELLAPGALLAATLVDESTLLSEGLAPDKILPDLREIGDWVYSSEPLWVQVNERAMKVRRLRERVSPDGEMERMVHDELLERVSPEQLEEEMREAGLHPAGRRAIEAGANEADSVAVLAEVR
jgi:SAM-dependent methyltransferase